MAERQRNRFNRILLFLSLSLSLSLFGKNFFSFENYSLRIMCIYIYICICRVIIGVDNFSMRRVVFIILRARKGILSLNVYIRCRYIRARIRVNLLIILERRSFLEREGIE